MKNIVADTDIHRDLLEKINTGLRNKDNLTAELAGYKTIEKDEIDKMWRRVQLLSDKKIFLSKHNFPK